jgi:hypothetical protein
VILTSVAIVCCGVASAQSPGCDVIKRIAGSAAGGVFPAQQPTIPVDGKDIKCVRASDTLVSCTLAQIRVCNNSQPAPDEIAAFQTRMQRLTASMPAALKTCLSDRTASAYQSETSFDGLLRQNEGLQYLKDGEPSIRLVTSVSRSISSDQRCELSAGSLEFRIE